MATPIPTSLATLSATLAPTVPTEAVTGPAAALAQAPTLPAVATTTPMATLTPLATPTQVASSMPVASSTALDGAAATTTPASLSLGDSMATSARQLGVELPQLLQALAVLLIGWLLAVVLARTTRRVLQRAGLDERLARLAGRQPDGRPRPVSVWLGQSIFYLILLFTLSAFFRLAGLETLAAPLTAVTNSLVAMLPALIMSIVLMLVAWLVASGVRFAVERGATAAKLDSRLAQPTEGDEPVEQMGVAESLALGAQALVYLLFLIPILNTLGLSALADPMTELLSGLLAMVPSLLTAGAILLATWFIARLVVLIVAGLSSAAGVDAWGARFGVTDVRLSKVLAAMASALVIIPGTVIAVNALGIPAISDPLNEMVNQFVALIPAYVAAGMLLVVAWIFGRILAGITRTVVAGLGLDRLPHRLGFAADDIGGQKVSDVAGTLLWVAIMLLAASKAADMLALAGMTQAIQQIWDIGLRLLLSLGIALIGIYLANLAYAIALSALGPSRRPLALIVRIAVLVFAFAIALTQLGVGESIVTAAFAGLVFGLAGAAALAFGLGGRDLAGRILDREYFRLEGDRADALRPAAAEAEADDAGS